ncbi:hypothetical protein C2S51_038036 [Perilla frutescens var. frutescens]|nr:hypothetical protein C2S51_038036 [Perilla frutescens var. frutescens]
MVRPTCVDSNGMKKGAWSEDEDNKLRAYILRYGHWNWRLLPKYAGLKRCGKSCRLRWVNYLKPGVKRGNFTKEEEDLVIKLHAQLGNKWSTIAAKLPGRTDNEIKNFWHTRVEKRRKQYPAAAKKPINSEASSSSSSINLSETTDSSEAISSLTTTSQHLPSPPTHAHADASLSTNPQDQLDLMLSHILAADTNHDQNDFFAPLFEEEFHYPEFHNTEELSSSGSSYMNNWTADDDDQMIHISVWNESSTSNSSNSECESSDYIPLQEEGLPNYYDPLFQYFDYDMNRFC